MTSQSDNSSSSSAFSGLSIQILREILDDAGVDHSRFVERNEFEGAVMDIQRQAEVNANERAARAFQEEENQQRSRSQQERQPQQAQPQAPNFLSNPILSLGAGLLGALFQGPQRAERASSSSQQQLQRDSDYHDLNPGPTGRRRSSQQQQNTSSTSQSQSTRRTIAEIVQNQHNQDRRSQRSHSDTSSSNSSNMDEFGDHQNFLNNLNGLHNNMITGIRILPNGAIMLSSSNNDSSQSGPRPGHILQTRAPTGPPRLEELFELLMQSGLAQVHIQGHGGQSSGGVPAASRQTVEQLPTTQGTENDGDCMICLDKMDSNTNVRTLPCLHRFHTQCIDRWLSLHNSCPVCKNAV